jgi:hypothetical protein
MKHISRGRLAPGSVLLAMVILPACQDSPASPSNSTAPPTAYTVKVALVGMDPYSLEVPVGARVTFINNDDNFPHHFASACSEVDGVGRLEPRQSGQTAPFTTSKTCSYYDRLYPENPLRQGKIVVR